MAGERLPQRALEVRERYVKKRKVEEHPDGQRKDSPKAEMGDGPSLRQLNSKKTVTHHEQVRSGAMGECEIEEIAVDRSKKIITKNRDKVEMKEIFEELYLSRKRTKPSQIAETPPEKELMNSWPGQVPDEDVTSIIEMLRPSLRQLYANKNALSTGSEITEETTDSRGDEKRCYESEPIPVLKQPGFLSGPPSAKESATSLDTTITSQSNMTELLDEDMIKTMLAPSYHLDKGLEASAGTGKEQVNVALNAVRSSKRRKRSRAKKWKGKNVYINGLVTDNVGLPEDGLSKMAPNKEILTSEIFTESQITNEPHNYQIEPPEGTENFISKAEGIAGNEITVFRNKIEWTENPFSTTVVEQSTEGSNSNVDSEPTRGCSNTFQYKIQLNHPDKNSSNTELKRFKAILHTGKRCTDTKERQNNTEQDCESSNSFSKSTTDTKDMCLLNIAPFSEPKNADVEALPSQCTLNIARSLSDTSLSSTSYGTSFSENRMPSVPCYSKNIPFIQTHPSGKPKEFWAITKINVYPDNSRTYEVMPLRGKKPAEVPENSDSVFVLIPPNHGPFVPCDLC